MAENLSVKKTTTQLLTREDIIDVWMKVVGWQLDVRPAVSWLTLALNELLRSKWLIFKLDQYTYIK